MGSLLPTFRRPSSARFPSTGLELANAGRAISALPATGELAGADFPRSACSPLGKRGSAVTSGLEGLFKAERPDPRFTVLVGRVGLGG